ncbi:MAG: hypothetical protein ACQETG_03330 [Thermodesulfobacteriota bacterium]
MNEIYLDNQNEDVVECFARFDIRSRICRKYCALRLRCAIEQSEQMRIEQLEDLMSSYEVTTNIQ